jgi:hypothetical protein
MTDRRRHPRITDTLDLLVTLRATDRATQVGAVLNLSRSGMLIAGSDTEVGGITGFELAGPGFRYAGVAETTHRTDGATGLRVLCWHGPVERAVRGLIERRSRTRDMAAPRERRAGAAAAV